MTKLTDDMRLDAILRADMIANDRQLRAKIEQWRSRFEKLQTVSFSRASENKQLRAEVERLTAAIHATASEGTYDEMAIRKAVSFELAELIADARAALERKP